MTEELAISQFLLLTTKCLILRPWLETDAESLYKYSKDPHIGIPAGWSPHKSVEERLDIIKNVLRGKECYAICEKENKEAIGAIALKLNGNCWHETRKLIQSFIRSKNIL